MPLLPLILALAGGLLAHISVNALNEYLDFTSGLDLTTLRTPFSGGSGTLPANISRPAIPSGNKAGPYSSTKYSPIRAVSNRVNKPAARTLVFCSGCAGKVPLPPLKGVRCVARSRPLVKSSVRAR